MKCKGTKRLKRSLTSVMLKRQTSAGGASSSAKRFFLRYGVKAAIMVAGAAVAAGTLYRPLFAPETRPLGQVIRSPAFGIPTPSATSLAASAKGAAFTAGLEHERVQYWIQRLAGDGGGALHEMLGGMGKYASMISSKLEARQMPSDLTYLAAIESEFKPTARSHVGAVGLWQFMAGTARGFGLVVHGKTDQRKDPAKETDAALTYLSSLHEELGSWYLAAAAYNAGEGAVKRALNSVLGKSSGTDEDFFKIASVLPKETQDYVPKLIATAQLANDPSQFGVALQGLPKPTAAPLPPVAAQPVARVQPVKPVAQASHGSSAHRLSKRAHHIALRTSRSAPQRRRTRSKKA